MATFDNFRDNYIITEASVAPSIDGKCYECTDDINMKIFNTINDAFITTSIVGDHLFLMCRKRAICPQRVKKIDFSIDNPLNLTLA